MKLFKNVSALVFLSLLGLSQLKAQTVVTFTETMGTPTVTTAITAHETANGFDNDPFTMSNGGAAGTADIRVTNVSSGYVGASGSANVFFTAAGTLGFGIAGISTTGLTGLTLQFGYRKESATVLPTLALEYSTNGTTWTGVAYTFSQAANATAGWYLTPVINLPAACENQANLSLRWVKSGAQSVRIDDVVLRNFSAAASLSLVTTTMPAKFYSNAGFASDVYSFQVNALNVGTNNVSVGAVTGFEYSTNAVGPFSGTLSLAPTAGNVSANVFTRMVSGAAGVVSGTCAVSCTGTTTQNVSLSGQRYAAGAAFTSGNLVVMRVGENGVTVPASAAAPAFLDELTPAGVLVQSVPFRYTVDGLNRRMVVSSSSTSDGVLNLSPDGQYLTFTGYDAPVFTAGVTATPAASNNRMVGLMGQNAVLNSTTRINDGYDGNNCRSAVTLDGNGFWVSGTGTGGGTRYVALGNTGTSTYVSSTPANTRVVNISNNNLYASAQSGAYIGISQVSTSGLPTTSGNTTNLISSISGASDAYGFVFLDRSAAIPGNDVVYVANNNAGLLKFYFDGTNWNAAGNITSSSIIGITAKIVGANVEIYCVGNAASTIYKITDTGAYNATLTGSLSTVYTAPAGTALRGVSLTPVTLPTPDIDHTFSTPGAATIAQGASNTPLYRVQLDVSTAAATLTGATFTTAGSYAGSDISDFKLYFSTDATLDAGDNVLGTISTSTGAGQSLAFTGLGQVIPIGTRYLFVTASVSGCASIGGTLNINSTALTAITYSQSTKTGTPVAGTSKSIVSGTLANVTGLTASSGSPTVQVSWTNPSCFDQILVVAHTANITGTPSGTVYTSNLNYSLAPAFAGGGKVVYYGSASPQFITGLVSGTTYNVKVFVRKSTSWSSGVQVSATPQNPTFYSVASGVAGSGAIWSLTPAGVPATAATLGGFTVNTSVVIQNGHTVTFSTSGVNMFNLTINAGGAMTAGGTSNTYMNINGNAITNNGTLGTIVGDGISFNIEGVNVVFGGSGVNNVARIRKSATTNATSTLVINSNVNVSFAGSAVYNNANNTNFNVTINFLKSLNLTATGGTLGDYTFDGTDGASTGERGGVLTVNGTLNMTGRLIATNNNTNAIYGSGIVINGAGRIFCKDVDINTAAGTGLPITISASGRLSVSGKMRMLGGTLAANNVVFNSGAVLLHGAGTLDGATACSGTVTGAIQYRRQGTTATYPSSVYNYWSSPVINATAGTIMGSNTGTNAYTFNPLLATASTQLGLLLGWTPVTSTTTMTQGRGYIATNSGLVTFTGVPYEGTLALPLTGSSFTKCNLVGNPYPSSVSATSLLAGNSGQIVPALHFWDDDNSAGAGFSPADYIVVNTIGASGGNGATWTGQIAAGQAFFVEGATTSNTFTFNNAMRNANAATFFEENLNLKRVWISLSQGATAESETMLAFLPDATNGFDLNYDAARVFVNSNLSLSTTLNNGNYAIQAWPSIDPSQIIPLSINATQAATHQIQISGIDNIDASILVFLEDVETGAVHNLREGAYSFEGNAQMSNSNRFRIRFSKPTVISAEGETCTGFDGEIGIESEAGTWNYTLSNATGQLISNGTTEDIMLFENLDGGDYLLKLNRNDYNVFMNVTILSAQTVDAIIMSSEQAFVFDPKSFSAVVSNATEVVWNFGDGSEVQLGENVQHTYEQPGIYTLSLTASNDECSYGIFQNIVVINPTVTAMEDLAMNSFRMLPNPAQNSLTLVKTGLTAASIEIVDLSGKVVLRETLGATAQTIDISTLSAGIYSVVYKQDKVYAVQKLVVQN